MNTELNYPALQKQFIKHFDGSLISVLQFKNLHMILNPCFTEHYVIDMEATKDLEHPVTTRDTTGESYPNGSQTKEEERNALQLAIDLKRFLISHDPINLDDLIMAMPELKKYRGNKNRMGKNGAFLIDGELFVVKGLRVPSNRIKKGYMALTRQA